MDTSRVLFVGPRVPAEWVKASSLLKHVDQALFRNILQVVAQIEANAPASSPEESPVNEAALEAFVTDKLKLDHILLFFAGVLTLFRAAVRQPAIKANILKEDLKELKLSPEFAADFIKAVDGSRQQATAVALEHKPSLPSLQQLQWRVDVSISTGALNRALRPTILMQMTLSDNTVQQFEVPLSQFHELRYNVAMVLKDMDAINQRNVFKIKDN